MPNPLDLDALRAVAKKATPGPWKVSGIYSGIRHLDRNCDWYYDDLPEGENLPGERRGADASHIATFDPRTVLALLDRLDAAERDVGRLREVRNSLADTLSDLHADISGLSTDVADMGSRIVTAIADAALELPHAD